MVLILYIHWVGSPERIILKILSFSSATPLSAKYKYTWLHIIPCSKQPVLRLPVICLEPSRSVLLFLFHNAFVVKTKKNRCSFFLLWPWSILNATRYFKVPHSLNMMHCLEIFWWSPVISFQNRKVFGGSNSAPIGLSSLYIVMWTENRCADACQWPSLCLSAVILMLLLISLHSKALSWFIHLQLHLC